MCIVAESGRGDVVVQEDLVGGYHMHLVRTACLSAAAARPTRGRLQGPVSVLGILTGAVGCGPCGGWRSSAASRSARGSRCSSRRWQQLQAGAGGGEGQQPALDARFEVHFVGAEARIDMRPSTDWLRAKTAAWK